MSIYSTYPLCPKHYMVDEEGGYIVRYEEPNMRVLMLEAEDIITLSNGGENEEGTGGSVVAPGNGGAW